MCDVSPLVSMLGRLHVLARAGRALHSCAPPLRSTLHHSYSTSTLLHDQCSNTLSAVGDSVEEIKKVTFDQVNGFSITTGDTNKLHYDKDFARSKGFEGGAIVHGALINGLVSGVIGTKLPGQGSILLNQTINFRNPLYIGEEVKIRVEVIDVSRTIQCKFVCKSLKHKRIVLEGEATLLCQGAYEG